MNNTIRKIVEINAILLAFFAFGCAAEVVSEDSGFNYESVGSEANFGSFYYENGTQYNVGGVTMHCSILTCIAAGFLLVPVTFLFFQVVFSLGRRRLARPKSGMRPRVGIIIPAHNEALCILQTIETIRPQLHESDRLLVIADNCSDDTARIASKGGAEVVERWDPSKRGKGYALDFGVQCLAESPPEITIVIDADCQVSQQAIDRLAVRSYATGRPVQALYLMQTSSGSGLRMRIAAFAWLVKNYVRPLGMLNLGLPCQLMGTGMAFPWRIIRIASLATGNIVEDLKLGIELALEGKPALFCPHALVTSVFPTSSTGINTQRTRWEHGHLGAIFKDVPNLLAGAFRKRDVRLLVLALDLGVPPLSLLTLLVILVVAANAIMSFYDYGRTGTYLGALLLLELTIAVLLAWVRFGRSVVSLWDLVGVSWYVLRKIPIYLRFLFRRQVEWIRSKRDSQ